MYNLFLHGTVNQVKLFYENYDNSRIMPGYKDNLTII